jgi:hypothetical protein
MKKRALPLAGINEHREKNQGHFSLKPIPKIMKGAGD